jgi:hypothetical protein
VIAAAAAVDTAVRQDPPGLDIGDIGDIAGI